MDEQPTPSIGLKDGTLIRLGEAKQREVLLRWRQQASGMDGERITHLEKPDDPVADTLLDAAGDAIGKGEVRQGVAILKLLVREYPHSKEAALARQAIDQFRKQAGHGR